MVFNVIVHANQCHMNANRHPIFLWSPWAWAHGLVHQNVRDGQAAGLDRWAGIPNEGGRASLMKAAPVAFESHALNDASFSLVNLGKLGCVELLIVSGTRRKISRNRDLVGARFFSHYFCLRA